LRFGKGIGVHRSGCFPVVSAAIGATVAAMSLNRSEQLLFDHLQAHKEERQHWQGKLQAESGKISDPHARAARLDAELRRYAAERATLRPGEFQLSPGQSLGKVSMRNLAELLLRLWGPSVAPRRPPAEN
jgi:hypothetical protein